MVEDGSDRVRDWGASVVWDCEGFNKVRAGKTVTKLVTPDEKQKSIVRPRERLDGLKNSAQRGRVFSRRVVADDKLRDEFNRHDCTHRHRVTVWVFWFEQRFRTRGEGKT